MPIAHIKSITIADDTNTNVVLPSDWNSVHAYTLVDGVSILAGGNTSGALANISSGTLYLAGGNNITLSQNANSITVVGGGVDAMGVSNIGNTSGNTGVITNNSFVLAGGNNITLSQATDVNGATVSISNGVAYLSIYEPYPFQITGTGSISAASNTSAPMSLFRFNVSNACVAEYVKMIFSMSLTLTTTALSTFSQSGTLQWGIYSNGTGTNNTRMSLIGSSSLSYLVVQAGSNLTVSQPTTTNASGVYSFGQTTSSNQNLSSGYTGLKMMLLGLNSTLTQGDYWLGVHHRNSSSSANAGIRLSLYGATHTLTGLAPMGSFSSAYTTGTNVPTGMGGNWLMAHGSYSVAGMTGLTNDVTMSQITVNVGLMPYMKFESRV